MFQTMMSKRLPTSSPAKLLATAAIGTLAAPSDRAISSAAARAAEAAARKTDLRPM